MRSWVLLSTGALGLWCACSENSDRPPVVDVTEEPTGSGGSAGEANATGGSAGAVGDATSGSGSGGHPSSLALDPEEVYAVGALGNDAAKWALVQLSDPEHYAIGFDFLFDPSNAVLHMQGLYYILLTEPGLRRFELDLFTTAAPSSITYPKGPADNDPILDTPGCDPDSGAGPGDLKSGPNDQLIYRCPGGDWYELGGGTEPVYTGGYLHALGNAGTALTGSFGVVTLPDGAVQGPSPAISGGELVGVRAIPSGYLVAVFPLLEVPELWEIGLDGSAFMRGTYPEQAEWVSGGLAAGVLDASGALYQQGGGKVLRRTIQGEGEVIYDSADHPVTLPANAPLLTGP